MQTAQENLPHVRPDDPGTRGCAPRTRGRDACHDRRGAAARARPRRPPPPTWRCSPSAGSSNTRWAMLAKPSAFSARFPRAVADAGFGEPALFRFHGDAIETLLALGEHDAATALLAELEEQARATRGVWALTIASRCPCAAQRRGRGWRRRVCEPRPRARAPRTTPRAVRARAHPPRTRDAATPESREAFRQGVAHARARGVRRARREAVRPRARAELGPVGTGARNTPACSRRPRNGSLPSSLPDAPTARWRTPCSSAPRRFSGTSRRSIGSSAFVPAPNSPPSWPPVKLQPFRRFPSRSSPPKDRRLRRFRAGSRPRTVAPR